ncbi:MAG: hypothetical protein R3C49_06720 [Planctomycetaceae bacterium]
MVRGLVIRMSAEMEFKLIRMRQGLRSRAAGLDNSTATVAMPVLAEVIGGNSIFIDGDSNVIGGTTAADHNVINERIFLYSTSAS